MLLIGQLLVLLLSSFQTLLPRVAAQPGPAACSAIKSLSLTNTTIFNTTHIAANTTVFTPGSCQSSANVSSTICRVRFFINTTETSSVQLEAWLPDTWFGRFLGLGNGGLGGCIDYTNLDYGSTLHFAAVGSDNGHDGQSGMPFLNHPEVINDFAFRAIHVEAEIGKQLVDAYYNRTHDKSYYLGCSTGGRQGMRSALDFSDDFDGIVAGAPAVDFNHLQDWSGALTVDIGAPNANSSASFISPALWSTISAEIMRQCDTLDGVADQIITEPDICIFRPEAIRCPANNTATNATDCLMEVQVEALRKIYAPLFGESGELLYPRYDPGAEADSGFAALLSGQFFQFTSDWFKFTIYNDTNHDFSHFNVTDYAIADLINPGGISTFNGNMSSFRDRGGKIITYHGRRDILIASGNSKRWYDLISNTLGQPSLDNFYRLFLVPGMSHCAGGQGASMIGQGGITSNAVNDSEHNVLLAVVNWVEQGVPPDSIIGTSTNGTTREHCRYPQRSIFNGTAWTCEALQ